MIGSARPSSQGAVATSSTRGGLERGRVGEGAAQVVVADGDGQGDRERAGVADEDAVLEVAEVAADDAGARGWLGARPQAVEAREVDDPGVVDLLLDRPDAECTQPIGECRPPPVGDDGDVAADRRAVLEHDTRDRRRRIVALRGERRDPETGADLDPVGRHHDAAQHPLERGAPAGEHHEVVVAGLTHVAGEGRWEVVAEADRGRAVLVERGEDVGMVVAQQRGEPGEEGVAVTHLRRAAAVPFERLVGRRRHGRVVALDDGHPVPAAGEHEGRTQA